MKKMKKKKKKKEEALVPGTQFPLRKKKKKSRKIKEKAIAKKKIGNSVPGSFAFLL